MIYIQNIYYMLSYAFQVLNEQGYKKIATEKFDNITELMSAILAKGIATQIKRGLSKEYIQQTEALSSIRGKLDISESIKTQTILKKQMVCTYDEFSVNGKMNKIIKSTAQLLLKSNLSNTRKKELRRLLPYFNDVESVDLHSVDWDMRYNRNNQTYQMLISVCYLVVKGLLQTNSDGNAKHMDFFDEQQMCKLYEKFILQYYRRHYNELNARAYTMSWTVDDGITSNLPIMRSDIFLEKYKTILIIDAKYYSHTMKKQYDKYTIHSNNLYQIFAYVKNCQYKSEYEDHKVSGMLLYARTDEEKQPDNVYKMHGNQITVRTLDLNLPFEEIKNQLNEIVESHFGCNA